MKNKKLLLTTMMILSLVLAISCKSNSNPTEETPPTTDKPQTPPTTQQTVAVDVDDSSKSGKTSTLKIEVKQDNSVKTKAKLGLKGEDITDAKISISGVGTVSTDPTDARGADFVALTAEEIKLENFELSGSGATTAITVKNAKVSTIVTKLASDNKYGYAQVKIKAEKSGKTAKEITVFVKIIRVAE